MKHWVEDLFTDLKTKWKTYRQCHKVFKRTWKKGKKTPNLTNQKNPKEATPANHFWSLEYKDYRGSWRGVGVGGYEMANPGSLISVIDCDLEEAT